MPDNHPWFSWQRRAGTPIRIGDRELIPIASVLTVRWPNGGFVLNRPVAIRVDQDGHSTELEITDIQHMVRIALLVTFSVYLLTYLLMRTGIRGAKKH